MTILSPEIGSSTPKGLKVVAIDLAPSNGISANLDGTIDPQSTRPTTLLKKFVESQKELESYK